VFSVVGACPGGGAGGGCAGGGWLEEDCAEAVAVGVTCVGPGSAPVCDGLGACTGCSTGEVGGSLELCATWPVGPGQTPAAAVSANAVATAPILHKDRCRNSPRSYTEHPYRAAGR
jgi:hypothetical protein